jgi:hypothetical protein
MGAPFIRKFPVSRALRTSARVLLLLHVVSAIVPIGSTQGLWRRERGTRGLNQAGHHHQRQPGVALVAIMVSDSRFRRIFSSQRETY